MNSFLYFRTNYYRSKIMATTPNMTAEDFKKLQAIAEEEVKMPDKLREIIDKNNYLPTLIMKWQKLYANQLYIVKAMEIDCGEKYGELLKYYKFQDSCAWSTTKEIESQINSNPVYCKMLRDVNTQKYYLNFIQETMNDMKNLNFVIKNYLDYKKMESSNY